MRNDFSIGRYQIERVLVIEQSHRTRPPALSQIRVDKPPPQKPQSYTFTTFLLVSAIDTRIVGGREFART